MGKGLIGLNPMHSDKFLFSNVSLAGLLTVLYAATDMKTFIVGKYHYILFYLTLSMYPRMLISVSILVVTNLCINSWTKTWNQLTLKSVLAKQSIQSDKQANLRKLLVSKPTTHLY